MGTALATFGFLAALMSWFQARLVERERLEQMEMEELAKSRGGQSLFKTADADTFSARRTREQFEKFFVPAFTVLLLGLQAAAAYLPWSQMAMMEPFAQDRATLAMALLGLLGLILFLLGKYSSGLAKLEGHKLLRAGASYLLLTAYLCFVTAGTFAAVLAGFPKADLRLWAGALCVVTGFIAVETLLGLILEIYRVRVAGRDARVLYDSRLVGMLGQPEAIFTTAAHALDYQFGFKVSETWFFRLLERALGWMILAQAAALVLSTCVVVINPGDQALWERLRKAGR